MPKNKRDIIEIKLEESVQPVETKKPIVSVESVHLTYIEKFNRYAAYLKLDVLGDVQYLFLEEGRDKPPVAKYAKETADRIGVELIEVELIEK